MILPALNLSAIPVTPAHSNSTGIDFILETTETIVKTVYQSNICSPLVLISIALSRTLMT